MEEMVSLDQDLTRLADVKLIVDNWLSSYLKIATSSGYEYLLGDFEEEVDVLCSVLYKVWKRKLITQKEYQETAAYCWDQVVKFKFHLEVIAEQSDYIDRLTGGGDG